jgi:Tol biopolymer transport system component/predicted Ser/Thr protein kinase
MTGTRLTHYEVLEKIGEGGMGVVYKGRDTHLDRIVALKILPAEAVADPERKRRFVREAKAASSLNHPNIIAIYDIDSDKGVDFIAMEFVHGQSLTKVIGKKGIPWRETVRLATQIASALAAAHTAGIIHRDLKPANVMVTDKGLVKVLDFGLAKLTEHPAGETAETLTEGPETKSGMILGTCAYMSPEQAEGKEVDARSDVFSFGVVLYEMLSGRRPFSGPTLVAVLGEVLHKDPPPLRDSGANVPIELDRLVTRCMRKDPNRRLHHMADAMLALEEIPELAPEPAKAATHRRFGTAIACGLAAFAGAIAVWLARPAASTSMPVGFANLTEQVGRESWPSMAADGKSFLFASNSGGNWDIYSQRVDGRKPINLTADSPDDDTQPEFSPDGTSIVFRSERDGGGIFVMGATGESVKRVTNFGFHPSWHPGGKEILCSTANFPRPDLRYTFNSRLFRVTLADGAARQLQLGAQDAIQGRWSPNGRRIAFWGLRANAVRDIFTTNPDGGDLRAVTDDAFFDWFPAWSPDGKHLYFSTDRYGSMNLARVALDEETGRRNGQTEPLTAPAAHASGITFARDGKTALYVNHSGGNGIHRIGFDPASEKVVGIPEPISKGLRDGWSLNLSLDGQWLAFGSTGREDIYIMKADGSSLKQLTDDEFKDFQPAFTPDGKQLTFLTNRSGVYNPWLINRDGSAARQFLKHSKSTWVTSWSTDGKRIALHQPGIGSYIYDADKASNADFKVPLPAIEGQDGVVRIEQWSPDGKTAAGARFSESGTGGLWLFEEATRTMRKILPTGLYPAWIRDGKRILYQDRGRLFLTELATRRTKELLAVTPYEIESDFALSPDNRTIYFIKSVIEEDVWLMRFP